MQAMQAEIARMGDVMTQKEKRKRHRSQKRKRIEELERQVSSLKREIR